MLKDYLCETAIGEGDFAPETWMTPSALYCLCAGDPSQLWLKHHGAIHGFTKDDITQTLTGFIMQKGNEYEAAWIGALAPDAVRVCEGAGDSVNPDKVRQTFALMQQQTPVITQAALCCADESIYGIADLLVHTHWLRDSGLRLGQHLPVEPAGGEGHYVVLDVKFKSGLTGRDGTLNDHYVSSQLRLYTYMLGQMQGHMPAFAYVIARDRVKDPIPAPISSQCGTPLDGDLAKLRTQFQDIVRKGSGYTPWKDECVFVNNFDDPSWEKAKKTIAEKKIQGKARELCHQISPARRAGLTGMGFLSLQDMLDNNITTAQLTALPRVGPTTAGQISAVLEANRTGKPFAPGAKPAPGRRQCEFYVDTEYFSELNVDFSQVDFTQDDPELKGCAMIFMLGVGWENAEGVWEFKHFLADAQNKASERKLLDEFCEFLEAHGCSCDADNTFLYHWTADAAKVQSAAIAHGYAADHLLRTISWQDLHNIFTGTPIGIPGAWGYGLKDVGGALASYDAAYPSTWPATLNDGANAMVQGWKAYAAPDPTASETMQELIPYLESDCRALYQITRWLRS